MILIFALAAVPISIADLKSFKIPNVYLWLLFFGIAPFIVINGFGSLWQLLNAVLVVFIIHLFGMGMGDVKLLIVIFLAFNSDPDFSYFALFSYLLSIAIIHLLILTLKRRKIVRNLPLAPSIFMGLALYLATR